MIVECSHCGTKIDKRPGDVNRSRKNGLPLFCNRTCFGLSRRTRLSDDEKKERKRLYDIDYRRNNLAALRLKKAAYFQRTYDPVEAAKVRKKRMPYHVNYCRSAEYRKYKKQYDRQYRATKMYGEYSDCFLLAMDIREECLRQQSDYEIRYSKGGVAKKTQRRRDYERTKREEHEGRALGNLDLGQRR